MTTPETPASAARRPAARLRANGVNYRDWIFRLVIFALILGSLAVSWWSLTQRLAPLQQRSRQLSSSVARLSAEVDDLDRKWTKAQAEEARRQLDQAHEELFADEGALQAWLAGFRLQAVPLAVQAKAEFGQPVEQTSAKAEKLAVIPATISLDFRASSESKETPASPYVRLLRLLQRLSTYDKRADLTELKVETAAGSIHNAALQFSLWAVEGDAP